ncbi:hypothetical protein DSM112329_04647 [Paraconexibacter sp. AEG42_29]|uniref:Uncharacterized protein n=1 Tax=Paraconexibacter sp. AEG42_29 TaxID=2997339 RepID=A0AAU7B249_9ACTN
MGATTIQHGAGSELRQAPEPDEWWQDSAFLTWYSPAAGIGGLTRIGHEPNHRDGLVALWSGVVAKDGRRFRRNVATPLTDADRRDDGFGAFDGRHCLTHAGDRLRYRVEDDGCRIDLEVEDFYPRTDFFPKNAGSLVDDFASSHFETSGRVTGTVELDGQRYEIEDGLCHRDRSWGIRKWDTLLNHRWMPGTFGPELSFGCISWHAVDGSLGQFGYVVRDGEVIHADAIDITVTMEADGVSYRAGHATWTFPDGQTFAVEARPIHGTLSEHHGVSCIDAICEVERDGRVGFCDLEVTSNPRAGTGPVTVALLANTTEGFSHR